MSNEMRGSLYAAAANVLWGISFLASRQAFNAGFGSFSLMFVRFLFASLVLLPILLRREGRIPWRRGSFFWLLASSLSGVTLYFFFEYQGIQRAGAAVVSLILAAIPAFSLIFSVAFRARRYRPLSWLGAGVSLVGVGLVAGTGAGGPDSVSGALMALGACVCWVIYIEINDHLSANFSSLSLVWWQAFLAVWTLIPFVLAEGCRFAEITPFGWGMALYLALGCSVAGYLLYVESEKLLDPFRTALFINLNPIAAVTGGVLWLGERLSAAEVVGGLLVLASIALVSRGKIGTE